MAHFAELDNNNIVLRVLVVADADTAGPDGVEVEAIGIQHADGNAVRGQAQALGDDLLQYGVRARALLEDGRQVLPVSTRQHCAVSAALFGAWR